MKFKLPRHITEILQTHIQKRDHVLDVGIGSFHVGEYIVKNIMGPHSVYIGIDLKQTVLERAETIALEYKKETLFYVCDIAGIQSTHIKNSSLDCIVLFHILHEYVGNHAQLSRVLHECDRILKIGGKILVYDFIIEDNNMHQIETEYQNYKEIMKSQEYRLLHDEIVSQHELLVIEKK